MYIFLHSKFCSVSTDEVQNHQESPGARYAQQTSPRKHNVEITRGCVDRKTAYKNLHKESEPQNNENFRPNM